MQPDAVLATKPCPVCGTHFPYRRTHEPAHCGSLSCRAHHDWGADEWAGAARMAHARQRAGIELSALDREALAR